MESLNGLKRSHHCGELRKEDIGKTVVLMGWAQKVRDLGALAFIDLRDRTGLIQLTFNQEQDDALYDKAKRVRPEYVLAAEGQVIERSAKNPDLATGEIEVMCTSLRILDVAKTPPIYIRDEDDVKE